MGKLLVQMKNAGLGEREEKLFRQALTEVVQKYEFLAKYAPEIMIGVLLCQWSLRQMRVFKTLANIEAELKLARAKPVTEAKPAGPPEPPPAANVVPMEPAGS